LWLSNHISLLFHIQGERKREGEEGDSHLTPLLHRTNFLSLFLTPANKPISKTDTYAGRGTVTIAPFLVVVFVALEREGGGADVACLDWRGGILG